jgi:hypothetical protein
VSTTVTARGRAYEPYSFVLCRVAGQPFDALEALEASRTLAVGAELAVAERELGESAGRLENELGQAIGESSDSARRRILLASARNLRRHGKLSAGQVEALLGAGCRRLADAFERWRSAQSRAVDTSRQFEATYDADLLDGRSALREVARDGGFLAGLALARPELYRSFSRSLETAIDELVENRSQRRMERALLKHVTRAAAKTSPFSTFGSTGPAELVRTAGPSLALPQGGEVRSRITVNKALYSLLYRRSLKGAPGLFDCFSVSLNPSLVRDGAQYELLAAQDGRERIVRVPAAAVIEVVVAILAEHDGILGYAELVRRLAGDLGAEEAVVGQRVARLIELGLLQLNSAIPDWESDWMPLLRARLETSSLAQAAGIRRVLDLAERLRAGFESAGAERRWTLVRRARRQISAASAGADGFLDHRLRQGLDQNPVYEDTSLPGPASLSSERLGPALAVLARWVDWMRLLSLDWSAHANLRAHFDSAYAGRAPFLSFYKSFYAEVYGAFERHEKGARDRPFEEVANPFGLAGFELATAAADHLDEMINRLWATAPEDESLHLAEAHIAKAVGDDREALESLSSSTAVSVALFVQVLGGSPAFAEDGLLVDHQFVHAGWGKFFSRFLRLFDPEVTARLQEHSFRHPACLIAELCDDSDFSFNANLHPPLAAYEINYPANLAGLRPHTNLALSALEVTPDPHNRHRLRLVHQPTGRDVVPVNVGFLSPLRRPPIFRVLELFSPVFRHRLRIPWHNPELPRSPVVHRPRIVFDRRVVLARRAWRLPTALISGMRRGVSPAHAFRRLDDWRRSLGMPRHVFFTVPWPHPRPSAPAGGPPAAGVEPQSPSGRPLSSTKPQYLSFGSSLAAELLFEVAEDHPGDLVIEEMLPDPAMLARRDGRRYATELVLQLDERTVTCG